MLINCPECNKEVSDKCGNCPHCGYPIEVQEILYEYEGETYNIKEIIDYFKSGSSGRGQKIESIIDRIFSLNGDFAKYMSIHDDIIRKHCPEMIHDCYDYTPTLEEIQKRKEQIQRENIPKCPTCGSTDLSKISTVKKAAKIGMFGIFGAGDIGKTWKCNNCGSRF